MNDPRTALTGTRHKIREFASRAWRRSQAATAHEIICAVAIVLIIIDTFFTPVSAVALGLLLIALAPWLLQFVKSAELPGGFSLELREKLETVGKEAEQAGLLATEQEIMQRPAYERVFSEDPSLALAGLRIKLEERIYQIADLALPDYAVSGMVDTRRRNLNQTIRELARAEVLTEEQYRALVELLPILNEAVHAGAPDAASSDWAMDIGPRLLAGLDDLVRQAKLRRF